MGFLRPLLRRTVPRGEGLGGPQGHPVPGTPFHSPSREPSPCSRRSRGEAPTDAKARRGERTQSAGPSCSARLLPPSRAYPVAIGGRRGRGAEGRRGPRGDQTEATSGSRRLSRLPLAAVRLTASARGRRRRGTARAAAGPPNRGDLGVLAPPHARPLREPRHRARSARGEVQRDGEGRGATKQRRPPGRLRLSRLPSPVE